MSWDLKVAEMKRTYITEQEIWQSTHRFYYHGKTTTSYKYGFIKALLESTATANEHYEISFNDLFYSFTKIYWNLVIHQELWQSLSKKAPSTVQKAIEQFALQHAIPHEWNFDQLPANSQLELIELVKKAGKRYVIGATYSDFNGEIYSFDVNKEYIKLHPKYYNFFQTHKRMLTNITNYQLALFLEKCNEASKLTRLLTRVELVTQRNSLAQFAQLLQQAGVEHCFYCQKKLTKSQHVDHFIPWSYMQSDQLWNFVLSCPTCNAKKNNKLAAQHYLETLLVRNDQWLNKDDFSDQFVNYSPSKLTELYQFSQLNGFAGDWQPAR